MNFKPIEGFENYIIYEDGRIFNKKFNRFITNFLKINTKLKYYVVCLCKNTKQYTKKLHRLLALAFIPNPNNLEMVDHIDRNPQNNAIENLRWCSRSTNMLNKAVQKNNKLGEKYIAKTKNNTYKINIKKGNNHRIQKIFKTLEDAIEFRNEWIKENPEYSL